MTNKFCEQNPFACNNNGSNRQIYDDCYYKQYIHGSVSPFVYMVYEGKYENCGKCRKDNFFHPYDLVDVESELRNQTRPMSACGGWKYNPNTKMPACKITKSQPIKFEDPGRQYIYNDNPTEKLVSHYYKDYQPNIQFNNNKQINKPIQNNTINTEEKLPYLKENKTEEKLIEEFAPVPRQMTNEQTPCMNSDTCECNLRGFSTFDPSVPVVYPPELCPIVFNNIKKPNNPGYFIPQYI